MKAETIRKYEKITTQKLKTKAQLVFNAWIRNRDKDRCCISCGVYKIEQASHYYSAGKYNHLRFVEDNVWGSCLKCNYFLHGNLIPYRAELIKRIGIERVNSLDDAANFKSIHKNDRFLFIEIIEKYK